METDQKAQALMRALEIAAGKKPLKVLVIDNYDSFVYNLVQYIGELGAQTIVYRNNEITLEEVAKLNPRQDRDFAGSRHTRRRKILWRLHRDSS
jgi:hypothetical protein